MMFVLDTMSLQPASTIRLLTSLQVATLRERLRHSEEQYEQLLQVGNGQQGVRVDTCV